jgi:predicted RNase H-like HicB family nuclease
MNTHAQAVKLASRPYLLMTALEETTDDTPIYFARVLEMNGCFGQGETPKAAVKDLQLAMVDFIESLLEDGLYVPEPKKLIPATAHTAAGAVSFVGDGKTLQKKQNEIHQDSYVLSSH